MKLPIVAGFIFPSGYIIDTVGIGHCKMALRYIMEHNLFKEYNESNLAEDDFLIEKLGAAKVAMYRGKRYIYLPYVHNWYLDEIKRMYRKENYEVHFVNVNLNTNDIIHKQEQTYNEYFSYNQTVIPKVCKDGSVVYMYNPARIGD